MIITVTIKDPDMLDDAIREAVDNEVAHLGLANGEESAAVAEVRIERARKACSRWFRYGEYAVIELDTEKGTATVVPVSP